MSILRDKPIEGHLLDLGLDPDLLTNSDRLAVARVVADALLLGDGWLQRKDGRLHRRDVASVTLGERRHNDGRDGV